MENTDRVKSFVVNGHDDVIVVNHSQMDTNDYYGIGDHKNKFVSNGLLSDPLKIQETLNEITVEVCQLKSSNSKKTEIEEYTKKFLIGSQLDMFNENIFKTFTCPFLKKNVQQIAVIGFKSETQVFEKKDLDQTVISVYQLLEWGYNREEIDDEENTSAANIWNLPSLEFQGLWESLYYEDEVKENLLHYAKTALLFSKSNVDPNIVNWNRLILLHGPPGTGKTSLCKALAQKISISFSHLYSFGQLLEINSHSLFSKWFSESGKLVMKMFKQIQEIVLNPKIFVCVLIDEVESLTAARQMMSGNEPTDSIRVVNALLTQLDLIKRYPNVLILTTSNLTQCIDTAFLDRADIRQYVGFPSQDGIYEIFYSCIQELIRVGIIQVKDEYLMDRKFIQCNPKVKSVTNISNNLRMRLSLKLLDIAKESIGLSGRTLRKLPFVAQALFVKSATTGLDNFLDCLRKGVDRHKSEEINSKFVGEGADRK